MQAGSLQAYVRALHAVSYSLLRSIVLAAAGATALTVLGFLVGYLIHTRALPIWRAVDAGTVLLFALPSTVIGVGLMALWNRPATNFIYGTPLMILLGYLALYTALSSRVTVAGLALVPASMEEAAASAGAGWTRRLVLIVLPLVKYALLSGWLIAYIFCLRDTGITMLVYPPGYDTQAVRFFHADGQRRARPDRRRVRVDDRHDGAASGRRCAHHPNAGKARMPVIAFKSVCKVYSGKTVLHDFSLIVEPGQRVVIVRPSGCGKTTVLRLLAGFITPDTGMISIDGHIVAADGKILQQPEQRRLGMVFQTLPSGRT